MTHEMLSPLTAPDPRSRGRTQGSQYDRDFRSHLSSQPQPAKPCSLPQFPPHCPSLRSVPFPTHGGMRRGGSAPQGGPSTHGGWQCLHGPPFLRRKGRTTSCIPGCRPCSRSSPAASSPRQGQGAGCRRAGPLARPFCNRHKRLSRFIPEPSVTLAKLPGKALGTAQRQPCRPLHHGAAGAPSRPLGTCPKTTVLFPRGHLHGQSGPALFRHQL